MVEYSGRWLKRDRITQVHVLRTVNIFVPSPANNNNNNNNDNNNNDMRKSVEDTYKLITIKMANYLNNSDDKRIKCARTL